MFHKTFISYKHDIAESLRDKIIMAMGSEAAIYYQGERPDSPDLSHQNTDKIKNYLKDMIYSTTVTIVVISPRMKQSEWIDWEIEYSLKNISRDGKTSHTNGLIGVVMEINGGYDWLIDQRQCKCGYSYNVYNETFLSDIIKHNRHNKIVPEYRCDKHEYNINHLPWCNGCSLLSEQSSYISIIRQEDFLFDTLSHIEKAYQKSLNVDDYNIVRSASTISKI